MITGWGAVKEEWTSLDARRCWDISKARKHNDVVKEAIRDKVTIHLGPMLELCYRKHCELWIG